MQTIMAAAHKLTSIGEWSLGSRQASNGPLCSAVGTGLRSLAGCQSRWRHDPAGASVSPLIHYCSSAAIVTVRKLNCAQISSAESSWMNWNYRIVDLTGEPPHFLSNAKIVSSSLVCYEQPSLGLSLLLLLLIQTWLRQIPCMMYVP